MKKTNLTVLMLILVVVTLLLSMASSAFAHEEPASEEGANIEQPKVRDWILRFGLVAAETSGSTSVDVDPGTVDIRLSGGAGGFANIEYKVLPFLGLEFGSTAIGSDMNVSAGAGTKHAPCRCRCPRHELVEHRRQLSFRQDSDRQRLCRTHARLQPLQQVDRPLGLGR